MSAAAEASAEESGRGEHLRDEEAELQADRGEPGQAAEEPNAEASHVSPLPCPCNVCLVGGNSTCSVTALL